MEMIRLWTLRRNLQYEVLNRSQNVLGKQTLNEMEKTIIWTTYTILAPMDDWACQLLWEESPIDSEYESFALTCWRDCEIETPNTVPWGGGSLDLDALYVDCSDGNDDACVLLSDLSPDSEIREFAKTCAGRGGDCSSFG